MVVSMLLLLPNYTKNVFSIKFEQPVYSTMGNTYSLFILETESISRVVDLAKNLKNSDLAYSDTLSHEMLRELVDNQKKGDEYVQEETDYLIKILSNPKEGISHDDRFIDIYFNYICQVYPRHEWVRRGYVLDSDDLSFLESYYPSFYQRVVYDFDLHQPPNFIGVKEYEPFFFFPPEKMTDLIDENVDLQNVKKVEHHWLSKQLKKIKNGELLLFVLVQS